MAHAITHAALPLARLFGGALGKPTTSVGSYDRDPTQFLHFFRVAVTADLQPIPEGGEQGSDAVW